MKTEVQIGLKNVSSNPLYTYIGEEDKVYVVDAGNFLFMEKTLYDFVKRNKFPVIASTEIRKVTVNKEGTPFIYIYDKVEESNSS